MPETLLYCEQHKPEKPNGKVFYLHPPKDKPNARPMPCKCQECGKQADWMILR